MDYALELKNVTKKYAGFTLDNIGLSLPSGCIMGLIGENGAGKSTIIKLILDMVKRDGGTITVLGRENGKDLKTVKESLGVVLDESCFPDNLRLKDINTIMKNIFRTWDESVFRSYAGRFSLPGEKTVREYSRGMKMKLAIATALSHDSRLLILDEATSGLDPVVREEILDVFLEFIQDEGHSIFISSHIISDLEKISDYIALLHRGKMVFCEEKDALVESYGILKCSASEFENIDRAAVRGLRKNEFGVEALVLKSGLRGNHVVDRASVEDIMLYHLKERIL